MRLIDVDALADALFEKRKNYPQWVADTIGNMPDAVVQCKDCKKRETIACMCVLRKYDDTFWCADGERREEHERKTSGESRSEED